MTLAVWPPSSGLSPRVRGNRWQYHRVGAAAGSIPACAGEPRLPHAGAVASSVYPRVCGGTYEFRNRLCLTQGLSPRVRGNRADDAGQAAYDGSIPACAGEPQPRLARLMPAQVYPRVCGGTAGAGMGKPRAAGLSPRVRGNRLSRVGIMRRGGSIPACAGEPKSGHSMTSAPRVYPRVCGGTPASLRDAMLAAGLSPRVRGNLLAVVAPPGVCGSIPACAGEPLSFHIRKSVCRVYPRVCGGTDGGVQVGVALGGLSPRVRGNHARLRVPVRLSRSIPACAGEPRHRSGCRY